MSNQVYSRKDRKYISRQVNEYFIPADESVTAETTKQLGWIELNANRGEYFELDTGDSSVINVVEEGIYCLQLTLVLNESTDPNIDRDIGLWIQKTTGGLKYGLNVIRQIAKGTDPGGPFYSMTAQATLYLKAGESLICVVHNILAGSTDVVARSSSTDLNNYTNLIVTKLD